MDERTNPLTEQTSMPLAQVWVLHDESRRYDDAYTLWPTEEAALAERLRLVHARWDHIPEWHDAPTEPPTDPEEAVSIYNGYDDEEYLAHPWTKEVNSHSGNQARFLWPNPDEGADPAIELGGVLVAVRREEEGVCVWVTTEAADATWPRSPEGEVPVDLRIHDGSWWRRPAQGWWPPETEPRALARAQALADQVHRTEGSQRALEEEVAAACARRAAAASSDGLVAQLTVLIEIEGEQAATEFLSSLDQTCG